MVQAKATSNAMNSGKDIANIILATQQVETLETNPNPTAANASLQEGSVNSMHELGDQSIGSMNTIPMHYKDE